MPPPTPRTMRAMALLAEVGWSAQPSIGSEVSRPSLISRSAMDIGFSWTWVSTSGPTYSSRPSCSWE